MKKIFTSMFFALALSPFANAHEITIDIDDLEIVRLAGQWCTASTVEPETNMRDCVNDVTSNVLNNFKDAITLVKHSCDRLNAARSERLCNEKGFDLLNGLLQNNGTAIKNK